MSLTDVKTVADIAQGLITTVGLVMAGVWTYVKFIKGRQFRPHVEITVHGDWLGEDGELGLRLQVRLKNIGTAKVQLTHRGTGVMVSRLAAEQDPPPAATRWTELGVWDVFLKHEWIEPGETIGEDLLLRLPRPPGLLEVRTRVILAWRPSIDVQGRLVLVPGDAGARPTPSGPREEKAS